MSYVTSILRGASETPTTESPQIAAEGASAREGRPGLSFQPGIEGLRGLAVLGVLLFHAGFGWAMGGFLGVSTFFTLSGYLITTLLISEHAGTGTISLRAFWGRRFRRLLPASLLALAAAVIFGWLVADAGQIATLRGDVIAALLDVANWRFIVTGQSYAKLFSGPSPVLQFWSLAIEEQFYLILPLLVLAVLRATLGSRRALSAALTGGIALSIGACLALYQPGEDPSRIYYGTGTRAAELLVGGLLAATLAEPDGWLRRIPARFWSVIGIIALAAVALSWNRVAQSDAWLYQGGLAAYAVVSAALILAAMHPGPVRTLLSLRSVRWLGAVSYGVYLFHWPIFLWLTSERTHLAIWPLFALRLTVTLALADLSYRLIERPARTGRRLYGQPPGLLVIAAVSVILMSLLAVTDRPPSTTQIFAAGTGTADQQALARALSDESPTTAAPADAASTDRAPAPAADKERKVLLVGDSMALTLEGAFNRYAWYYQSLTLLDMAWIGCSLTHDGQVKGLNTPRAYPPECKKLRGLWPKKIGDFQPDAVVVLDCLFDISDHRLPGEDRWRPLGDPHVDDYLRGVIGETVDTLSAGGAPVVFLTCPHLDPRFSADLPGMAKGPYDESDPARVDHLNQLFRQVAATKPAMRVLDLASYLEGLPGGDLDPVRRSDGVHWTQSGSDEVVNWLMPQVEQMPARPANAAQATP